MQRQPNRYDNVTVILHWTIGVGILLLAGLELFRLEFPKGHVVRETLKPIHQPLGTALFVLIMFRVTWRLLAARLPSQTHGTTWAGIAAGLVHTLLYALMIGLPLLGLVYVFGSDKAVDFGLFKVAFPMKSMLGDYAKSARWLHEVLGIAIFGVALLHAAAALFHHYILNDGLLLRMSLAVRRSRPSANVAVERETSRGSSRSAATKALRVQP